MGENHTDAAQDARIPDHCGWAARGLWNKAYDALLLHNAALRAEVEKDQRFIKDLCDQIEHLNAKVADWSVRAETVEAERDAAMAGAERSLPRLTKAMISAAGEGHYGETFAAHGGITGVDLTADGVNYTFEQGFRRMWKAIRAHLKAAEKESGHA